MHTLISRWLGAKLPAHLAHQLWHQVVRYAPLWLLGSLFLTVAAAPAFAPDDLLRHVVSYAWGYSHQAMYPYSALPAYNQYPLFDWFAGLLAQTLSTAESAKLLVAAVFACGMLTLMDALAYWNKELKTRLTPVHLGALALLVLYAGASTRFWLGRPEAWALCWAIFATTAGKSHLRQGTAVALGAVLSLSYWMAPLFFVPVLVARLPLHRALLLLGMVVGFHMGFWNWWSQGDIWHWPTMLQQWNDNRLSIVLETQSMVSALVQPAPLMLLFLALRGWRALSHDAVGGLGQRSLLVHALYWALNLIRLLPVALAGLLPLVVKGAAALRLPTKAVFIGSLVCTWLLINQVSVNIQAAPIPLFKVPRGALVLTNPNSGVYGVPFANPGTVQVIPAMEVGATAQELQKLSLSLDSFSTKCEDLQKYRITHVVENRALGTPPPCLHLMQTQGSWRLWEVTP